MNEMTLSPGLLKSKVYHSKPFTVHFSSRRLLNNVLACPRSDISNNTKYEYFSATSSQQISVKNSDNKIKLNCNEKFLRMYRSELSLNGMPPLPICVINIHK